MPSLQGIPNTCWGGGVQSPDMHRVNLQQQMQQQQQQHLNSDYAMDSHGTPNMQNLHVSPAAQPLSLSQPQQPPPLQSMQSPPQQFVDHYYTPKDQTVFMSEASTTNVSQGLTNTLGSSYSTNLCASPLKIPECEVEVEVEAETTQSTIPYVQGGSAMGDDDALLVLSSPSLGASGREYSCDSHGGSTRSKDEPEEPHTPQMPAALDPAQVAVVPSAIRKKGAGTPGASPPAATPETPNVMQFSSPLSCRSPLSPSLSAPQAVSTELPEGRVNVQRQDFGETRIVPDAIFAGLFERKKLLGSGRQGAVWSVSMRDVEGETEMEREDGRKEVAAKLLCRADMGPRDIRLALEEIDLLKKMAHPNIVCLYDSFVTETDLVILLQYCEKGDVSSMLHANCSFSGDRLLVLITQIGLAINYLHNVAHITHNDLKPSNILITSAGVVKLADFGVSSAAGPPPRERRRKVKRRKLKTHQIASCLSPSVKKMLKNPKSPSFAAYAKSPKHLLARSPAHKVHNAVRSPANSTRKHIKRGSTNSNPPTVQAEMVNEEVAVRHTAPPDSPPKHKNMRPPQVIVEGGDLSDLSNQVSAATASTDHNTKQCTDEFIEIEDDEYETTDSDSSEDLPHSIDKEVVRGTPLYWSPEVWTSVNTVTPIDGITNTPDCLLRCQGDFCKRKADIWSFGVICYEMCELSRPFKGQTLKEVARNVLEKASGIPQRVAKITSRTPFFQDLLLALLVEDPEERASIHTALRTPYLQRGLGVLLSAVRHATSISEIDGERILEDIQEYHDGSIWMESQKRELKREATMKAAREENAAYDEEEDNRNAAMLYPVMHNLRDFGGVVQKMSSTKKWSAVMLHLDPKSLWMKVQQCWTPMSPSRGAHHCMSPSVSKGKPLPLSLITKVIPDADPLQFAVVVGGGGGCASKSKMFMFRASTATNAEEWIWRLDLAISTK